MPDRGKGISTFCLKAPKGAAHKRYLSPFLFDFLRKKELPKNVRKAAMVLGMCLVVFLAILVRFKNLHHWHQHRDIYYYNTEPILTASDAYYSLRLARDLIRADYGRLDHKRGAVSHPPRPAVPPLPSVMVTLLARLAGVSLSKAAFFLPPFAGCLIIIPCFLWGRSLSGSEGGIAAALMGATNYCFYARSDLGWFDTDVLNVFFVLMIPYFLLLYSRQEDSRRRYVHLALSVVFSVLFLWWWWGARFLVGFLLGVPLLVSILTCKESRLEKRIKAAVLLLAVLVAIAGINVALPDHVRWLYHYMSGGTLVPSFPKVTSSISEMGTASLGVVTAQTSGNAIMFAIAAAGFLILIVRRYRDMLFLAVPFALGLFSVIFARRFLIFLAPFVGFGLGHIFQLVSGVIKKRPHPVPLQCMLTVIIILIVVPNVANARKRYRAPRTHPSVIGGLETISRETPPDALIWCWWDLGYTAQYWADRATFIDGGSQRPERAVFSAMPLASSPRLAANAIKFFAFHGAEGFNHLAAQFGQKRVLDLLRSVLSAVPEERDRVMASEGLDPSRWRGYFFPGNKRRIYLVFDGSLPDKIRWWHRFGTWRIGRNESVRPTFINMPKGEMERAVMAARAGKQVRRCTRFQDYRTCYFPIGAIVLCDRLNGTITEELLSEDFDYILEVIQPSGAGYLVSKDFYESTFNQMFVLNRYDETLFKPAHNNPPHIQVWEVLH